MLPPTLQGCDSFLENPDSPLVMPVGKVMVLGNDFCQKSWHETCLHQDDYDLNTPTWKYLLPLLKDAGIPPRHCFFTNAYMGLRLAEDGMGPSPGADDLDFVARCRSFLFKQIEVQKPRLILALGKHSIQLIAGLSPDLTAWEGCKTFPQLDELGPVIGGVHFNGDMEHPVTVVALVHPSMRPCNVGHRRYCGLTGKAAELAMLKDALNLSGLQRL